MANYGFTPGSGATARSQNPSGTLHIPYVFVSTAIHTVVGSHLTQALTTASASLTSPPAGSTHALIQADGVTVRWTEDGTTPTATVGFKLADGNAAEVVNLANIKVRAESGTGNLQVTYRRYDQ